MSDRDTTDYKAREQDKLRAELRESKHLARAIAAERALERIAEEFWREGVTHEQFIEFSLKEVRRITGSGLAVAGEIATRDAGLRRAVIDAYGIMFPEFGVGDSSDRQSWFNQYGELVKSIIGANGCNHAGADQAE